MPAKRAWGKKRTCHICNTHFYDLRRSQIVCPACGAVHDPDRHPKPRRQALSSRAQVLAGDRVIAHEVGDELAEGQALQCDIQDLDGEATQVSAENAIHNDNNALIEDTSELGEDDDDIGEVIDHMDDEADEKH